jgi:hypothetical protein
VVVALVSPSIARACVAAAWRTAGLGVDDRRIDAMIARAHSSAVLPEMRLRVMRLFDEATHTTTSATLVSDGTNVYDATGAKLWLEARLTWHLDRLLYADDEPTLERVRLERQDARARLAARALELLFAWQRGELDARAAPSGSHEQTEALVRSLEAEATLDVLTGGWFSAHRAEVVDAPASPSPSP